MADAVQVSGSTVSWWDDDYFRVIPSLTVYDDATRTSMLRGPDGAYLELRVRKDPIGYIWPQEKE